METRDATKDASTSAADPHTTSSTSASRPMLARAPMSNPNFSSLPPLMTSNSGRSPTPQKMPTYTNKHLSTFSNSSAANSLSRPQSTVFPYFLSSLPYALVRDFAYPSHNQLHYGVPLDQPSGVSTPASELNRRVSDPHGSLRAGGFRALRAADQASNDASYFGLQLPARSFADGPPYAVDADLLSPIVTTTKHKKTKSNVAEYGYGGGSRFTTSRESDEISPRSGFFAGAPFGSIAEGDHQTMRLPSDQQSAWRRRPREESQPFDPNMAPELHASSISDDYSPSDPPSDDLDDADGSRLSRAYQFTIASPDEEYHGKAVALFDFVRENDNELPFFEGQVLWVSYRHGEGWLVAQDPKSGESGLIPEEYVRLLRDIEGGLSGLKGDDFTEEDADLDTPVELRKPAVYERPMSGGGGGNSATTATNGERYAPVLSHFTTSSKDLQPYSLPQSQQQQQQQQPPPQGHLLGSQQNTPVASSQPNFDARTAPPTRETINTAVVAPPVTNINDDDGGGVLLSPETFKREESFGGKRDSARKDKDMPSGGAATAAPVTAD